MSVIINPSSSGGGGGMAIGGSVTGGTQGSVLFIGAGGVLAQDNANFFWDDTNFNLEINGSGSGQGIYYTGGIPGLYRVPNVLGDNWFEGGAGNTSVTGYANFGTGSSTLQSLTSGFYNCALGENALQSCTSGSNNMAVGHNSLFSCTIGSRNSAVGGSLGNVIVGTDNTAIGSAALGAAEASGGGSSSFNIGIGSNVAAAATTINQSIFIGYTVGAGIHNSTRDVLIGFQAGGNLSGTTQTNVVLGGLGFTNSTSGSSNTMIGDAVAYNLTGGSENTLLGTWRGPSASVSNAICISDGSVPTNPQLDWNYTNANVWTFQYPINVVPVATASLPSAGVQGRRAFVTDATSTTFGAAPVGSGSHPVPVFDNGTSWLIG